MVHSLQGPQLCLLGWGTQENWPSGDHFQAKGRIVRTGVIGTGRLLQVGRHVVQETVSVKVLTDQFKGLGPVVDIDNWRARCFRTLSLEVTLVAHETKDLWGNVCKGPCPGDPDTVLDPLHQQLQVVFCNH